jgi:AraC family cel operon transcriptional repressor
VASLRLREIIRDSDECHYQRSWIRMSLLTAIHDHDFHEVFWVGSGKAIHLLNGDRSPLHEGSLVLVHAADRHGLELQADDPFLLTNVAFPCDTWRFLLERYHENGEDPLSLPAAARQLELGPSELAELDVLSAELAEGARSRRAIERFLLNILYVLDRLLGREFPPGTPEWLVDACRAVQEPRHFRRGPAALTKLAGHSAEHVAREARRWLQKTPTDLINEARLAHAASLLSGTDRPIVEIALECGYESLSHFYRLFRTRHGTSPAQYRSRQQRIIVPR